MRETLEHMFGFDSVSAQTRGFVTQELSAEDSCVFRSFAFEQVSIEEDV